jgi:hypothetical protein
MNVEQRGGALEQLKKIIMTISILLVMIISSSVKAANLTEEEYERLRYVFSDARISFMSDEDAARYLSYDLEHTNKVSKYYRVTETTNGTISTEVSKEEAISAAETENNISPTATYHTTSYKNIEISTSQTGTNSYLIYVTNNWLITPRVKSYDVIAMRVDDATISSGTQSGVQFYTTNGVTDAVNYSYQGTNMVLSSNGFGISMNLVDAASGFTCEIEAIVTATTKWATVYGSYQHAMTAVTLAKSKSYTISHNGYGKVINFATAVQNDYDNMQGVSIELGYTA